jgi:YesN/AraC family two-component response regulator
MLILICDDEPMVRIGLKAMLEEIAPVEHEYIEAENGHELIKKAALRPDIAFVDVQMPIMGGLDAIEAVAELYPEIRWALLTGYAQFDYAQRALQLGVVDYLLKPVGIKQIAELMSRISVMKDSDRTVRNYLKSITDHEFDVSSSERIAERIQEITGTDGGHEFVADIISKAKAYVLQHYRDNIGVSSIAYYLQITPNYLSRIFNAQTGTKLSDYLSEKRISKAKELLENPNVTIKGVAGQVGYYNAKHFAKVFQKMVGITPSKYQRLQAKKT